MQDRDLPLHIDRCMTPEERMLFLDTFTAANPSWRGAQVADVLDNLDNIDAHLNITEPMYDEHAEEIKKYPRGLFRLCVYFAVYTGHPHTWNVIQALMERFCPPGEN